MGVSQVLEARVLVPVLMLGMSIMEQGVEVIIQWHIMWLKWEEA